MYKKETGIFMYKYNNNFLPQSFDGLFKNINQIITTILEIKMTISFTCSD